MKGNQASAEKASVHIPLLTGLCCITAAQESDDRKPELARKKAHEATSWGGGAAESANAAQRLRNRLY